MPEPTLQSGDSEDEADEEEQDAEDEIEETEDEETETETEAEEEEPVEEVEMPSDEETEGDGETGILDGSTFGVSNKVLLGIGVSAVIVVLVLRMASTGPSPADRERYGDPEDVDKELEEGSDGSVQDATTAAMGKSGKYDEQVEEQAVAEVFGG